VDGAGSAVSAGAAPSPPSRSRLGPEPISSAELFGEAVELLIEHGSQLYRLRRTSLGKLILTK
jgi:hemin uptake protein HemP